MEKYGMYKIFHWEIKVCVNTFCNHNISNHMTKVVHLITKTNHVITSISVIQWTLLIEGILSTKINHKHKIHIKLFANLINYSQQGIIIEKSRTNFDDITRTHMEWWIVVPEGLDLLVVVLVADGGEEGAPGARFACFLRRGLYL